MTTISPGREQTHVMDMHPSGGGAGSKILTRREDGIGWLTINQPEKRNAISLAMWDAIAAAADDFATDPAIRVVVMHGAGGKAFASGADISEFDKVRANADAQVEYGKRSALARKKLEAMDKPLIAMIQGFCIGGGYATALVADLRIASSDSRFGIPAAKLGIAYGYESLMRLTALAGPAIAKEILFTGRQLDATEALSFGLVNRVVPPEQLEETTVGLAQQVARNSLLSIRASKAAIDQIAGDPALRDQAAIEALNRACFDSQDYAEGRSAFAEKRPPQFTGR
ncbi:MAG: putative 3-hydroxybutyryl-CoA dehydratase [Roseomonas sp.]|nr:putative 3-hydroxybutyryl-CoA dehydratase [Roseomonas sp.]